MIVFLSSLTMFATLVEHLPCRGPMPADVVEIPFLLPAWQAARLETEAHRRGITTAQMVRRLILAWLREAEGTSLSDTV
jgi:hypothetical protein